MNCLQFFIFTRFFAVWSESKTIRLSVVNCLQFFIFTRFFAVFTTYEKNCRRLWIAYNFLSLQGSLQSLNLYPLLKICCELLTIFYLYKVLCSTKQSYIYKFIVVNCLQFFIFTRFFAVNYAKKGDKILLWIAYNFLSLQGSLQLFNKYASASACCELLTIFYLYKVLCSEDFEITTNTDVVNCLQFFIFTRFFAVQILIELGLYLLWIAYNFLSLQGSLQ